MTYIRPTKIPKVSFHIKFRSIRIFLRYFQFLEYSLDLDEPLSFSKF
ncbi:hypothetical protein LSS_05528 [Leptospira santarosai serovar Shermani str. LT 821]|uniref:Uncharacterized protein n=1 Tax=Leptospira santarosai serovar Shermani str. LT 821 TaxID=758847 RepID=K8YEC3_9LEPT|nr:hypothetical protein LSS_05528 [Leptospira santarosai serovar Shermani str. LT 821]